MSSIHNIFGGLKLSSLKKLRTLFPKSRKMGEEAHALIKANRDKVEGMLPPDFSWAYLYELNIKEMNILALAAMGHLDELLQAAHAGLDLNQFLIEEAVRSAQDESVEVEWSGGHGDCLQKRMFSPYNTPTSLLCVAWVFMDIISMIWSEW